MPVRRYSDRLLCSYGMSFRNKPGEGFSVAHSFAFLARFQLAPLAGCHLSFGACLYALCIVD